MVFQRQLNSLATSSRIPFVTVVSSAVLGGGLTIWQAWLLASILDQVHLRHADLEQTTPSLIILSLIILFRAALVFVNEQGAALLSESIRDNLRVKVAEKILRLGPAYIEQQQAGELAYASTAAIDTLDAYFSQYLPQLVICAVLPVSILIIVFPLDALSAVILLLTAPLIPIFMILVGKTTETLTQRQFKAFSRMSAFFHDSLRGLAELKNLGRSAEHASRLDKVSETYREATMSVLRVSFLSALVLELAATLSVAVIAVQIGIRLLYGQMDFQQAFFFLVIAPEFYLPLRQLGVRFHAAQNGVSAARRIFAILNQPEYPIEKPLSIVESPDFSIFKAPFEIRFENVSFAYPGREQEAVSHVSCVLLSGETTALVGLNGSGKSTLASLLLRFIRPQEGLITLNGIDIQSIPIDQWRAGIAYLNQQPAMFNATIRENLLMAAPDADNQWLMQVLADAQLLETINSLPAGLDTQLGENAYRISGGQTQRLGLARAFLKDAPLLVLDEPTSHLDALLEASLDQSLAKLQKNRTCLLIAHRKNTAREADQVLMMDKGKLICTGRHADILKSSPPYAALFNGVEV